MTGSNQGLNLANRLKPWIPGLFAESSIYVRWIRCNARVAKWGEVG